MKVSLTEQNRKQQRVNAMQVKFDQLVIELRSKGVRINEQASPPPTRPLPGQPRT